MQLTSETERRFNDGEEAELVKVFRDYHKFAYDAFAPFLEEAQKDLAFYLGDQWSARDKEELARQRRNALVFNRVRRNVKMVTGFERKSRHSILAQPVENSDETTADQLSAVMLWAIQRDQMQETLSDAFEGALKTGINLVQLSVDYSDDYLNGDIKLARVPHNQFLLDPRFTRRDLRDCEYILQRRLLSHEACKSMLPDRADDIDSLQGGKRDSSFPYLGLSNHNANRKVLRYDEMWRRKFREEWILVNRVDGSIAPIEKGNIQRAKEFAKAFPEWEAIRRHVPTVELVVFVEEIPMWAGDDPWGIDDFPHTPIMAFWDPEHTSNQRGLITGPPGNDDYGSFFSRMPHGDFSIKLQSLVRCTRDPQTEANKRRSKMLDIIDSQLNTGWQAKSGAVKNPKSLFQAGQGRVIWMDKNASMDDARRIEPPDIRTGMMAMSDMMDRDIVEIAGITDELLGMPEESSVQMSGVLASLRQGAGLTVIQDLFDHYRAAQKLFGRKLIRSIQSNFTEEKIRRIINEEPTQEFKNSEFGKYDCVVEEAMETPTQRALAYTQLLQARQLGIPIPDDIIIDFMPLQNKAELREAMAAQAQRQQVIENQALEDQARLRELQRAKVFSDLGLGVERIARSEADRGLAMERVSELQENNAMAVLHRVKAIKEIEQMDTDRLMRLLEFFKTLEDRQVERNIDSQDNQDQLVANRLQEALAFVTDQSAQQPGVQ